jgi:ring-1,2-phenylacetyl-CoA epoxidase subunit PaaD
MRTDLDAGLAVQRALRAVEDPELPVSIVDLGMVRAVTVSAGTARVELVPTFLACPALWLVEAEVRERAMAVPGVGQCEVTWLSGGWSGADVTAAGRAALAAVGLVVPDGEGAVRCPFCGSADVAATSAFGSAVCRSAAFCPSCRTPVEVLKTKGPAGPVTSTPASGRPVELRLVRRGEAADHGGASPGAARAGALMPWMNKS